MSRIIDSSDFYNEAKKFYDAISGGTISFATANAMAERVGEGKFFIGGAAITLGGALSSARATFQLKNPATSGKVIYVVRATIYSSVAQQIIYEDGATMTTPSAVTPRNMNLGSTATSIAEMSHSSEAPTGGVEWPNQSRVNNTEGLHLDFPPLIVPPGKSLTIRGTDSNSQTFTANAYWFEEPIPA